MAAPAFRVTETLFSKRAVAAWAFAALFVSSIAVGRHVVFSGDIVAGLARNYMTPLTIADALLVLLGTPVVAVLVVLLAGGIEYWSGTRAKRSAEPIPFRLAAVLWLLLATVLLAAWAPYILTYAPGSVMSDSLYSIAGDRTNHHPILFTAIVHAFARAGEASGDINRGILAYTVAQSLVLALSFSAGIVWALKRGAPRLWAVGSVGYFALVPVFPIYAISVQKDPLFSLFVTLLAVVAFAVAHGKGAPLGSGKGIALFLVAAVLVLFFRNNGVVVVLATALAMLLFYRRGYLGFYAAVAALLVVTILIQGPGYDALQVRRNTFVESIGIMLQQVGYVVASDGDINEEQQKFLSGMLPYEEWRNAYAPCLVDTLKWNPAFNGEYLNANRVVFLRTWADLLGNNPAAYAQAYALTTHGFWKTGAKNQYGFADTKIVPNELGVAPTDLFEELTGTSIKAQLDATRGDDGSGGYFGAGLFIWITLLAATVMILRRKERFVLALAPLIALWASVMIATPVAFSLRYVFAFAICLPGILLLPFLRDTAEEHHGPSDVPLEIA